MAIDAAFKFVRIVDDRKNINWKRVPQERSLKIETSRIEITRSKFISKTMRTNCQSGSRVILELRCSKRRKAR